jgi:hypothetical protein
MFGIWKKSLDLKGTSSGNGELMNNEMKKSIKPPAPLIVKIAIAMTFLNSWVIFEEVVVDRTKLWHYMPFYRVGLFCTWDVLALVVILLLVFLGIAPFRRAFGRMGRRSKVEIRK